MALLKFLLTVYCIYWLAKTVFKALVLPYLVTNAQKRMQDLENAMRQQANQQTYTHYSDEGNVNVRFDKNTQQPTPPKQQRNHSEDSGDYIEYEEVE